MPRVHGFFWGIQIWNRTSAANAMMLSQYLTNGKPSCRFWCLLWRPNMFSKSQKYQTYQGSKICWPKLDSLANYIVFKHFWRGAVLLIIIKIIWSNMFTFYVKCHWYKWLSITKISTLDAFFGSDVGQRRKFLLESEQFGMRPSGLLRATTAHDLSPSFSSHPILATIHILRTSPLPVAAAMVSNVLAPDFSAKAKVEMKRPLKEAHLHNAAQLA